MGVTKQLQQDYYKFLIAETNMSSDKLHQQVESLQDDITKIEHLLELLKHAEGKKQKEASAALLDIKCNGFNNDATRLILDIEDGDL